MSSIIRRVRSSVDANNKPLLLSRKPIASKSILFKKISTLRDLEIKASYLISLIKLILIY
jgi:hypothetical protein